MPPCDTDPHDFRPKGPPPWAPNCGKSPHNARLMASVPLETRATGAVLDVMVCGDCASPHQAAGLDAPRSAATSRVVRDGLSTGQRARRTQPAIEVMPRCNMHFALRAVPHGWAGDDVRHALRASSAYAKRRGGSVRSICWQRAGASALRRTLEHECAHVCRPSEYTSVISVISMYHMYGLHTLRIEMMTFVLAALIPFPR